ALARQFLAPNTAWDDRVEVRLYDPGTLQLAQAGGDTSTVVATARQTGRIAADGSYTPLRREARETYRVRPDAQLGTVITSPPRGLFLAQPDRNRSFRARNIYFLAPPFNDATPPAQLVPDRVFLPASANVADSLVRRLLLGPTAPLAGAVVTSAPVGMRLRQPVVTGGDGTITVDLTKEAAALPGPERNRLSAQLVWTLRETGPGFRALRLLADGRPLEVQGTTEPQDRTEWEEFDPEGLAPRAPAYYIADRRLRSLDGGLTGGPASEEGGQLFDTAAVSPVGSRLALLTDVGRGPFQLRTGPLAGPLGAPQLTAPGLRSLSWGSGERGLWLLQTGARQRVLLVPNETGAAPLPVRVAGIAALGRLAGLRVSRDGARMALWAIAPGRQDAELWVGRIAGGGQRDLRVEGLRQVAPNLTGVVDAAWESGTSLVALGRPSVPGILPVRVAVDGSAVVPIRRLGLETATALSVAAAPGRPLVVGVSVGKANVLFREESGIFRRQPGPGVRPFYPG
ncbi:MAG TPA: LpqB family beta-propeller domain-containing protein, partial [Mycobacteriales bacterium]|nr:LpqB family beta-propeller domain-containing protein [Mycobacteriales bacterium]